MYTPHNIFITNSAVHLFAVELPGAFKVKLVGHIKINLFVYLIINLLSRVLSNPFTIPACCRSI